MEAHSHELLTGLQAAQRLNVSQRTLSRWVAQGRIPAVRIGGAVRFDPEALAAVVAQNTTRPTATPKPEQPNG